MGLSAIAGRAWIGLAVRSSRSYSLPVPGDDEVTRCLSLAMIKIALDLVHQDGSTPAELNCLAYVPFSRLVAGEQFNDAHIVTPRYLCNNLLHKCPIGVCGCKGTH